MADAIFTIGHSNRTGAAFLQMLRTHGINLLVDVRTMPRSRFNPHFNGTALARELEAHGIGYRHMPELGGKRAPSPASRNTFFRREGGLQSYADYMATPAFGAAMQRLLETVEGTRAAIMCAEAKPENCHRQLVADALLAMERPVIHIVAAEESRPHAMHPAARVDAQGGITYPAKDEQLAML